MNFNHQNSLRNKLEKELQQSQWLRKFKRISYCLSTIKIKIPLTQLCELKWLTETDTLVIHCPNLEARNALVEQVEQIKMMPLEVSRIMLKLSGYSEVVIDKQVN